MNRRLIGLLWVLILIATIGTARITLFRNTVFTLGLLAGVAVGALHTASNRLLNPILSTGVGTLSTAVIVATLSVIAISQQWLPPIETTTLGYALGIVSAWLLVSGLSLDELGGFAAISGLLLAVVGGATGILFTGDLRLFLAVMFAGLMAGVVVPLSGFLFGELSNDSGPRRSRDDDGIESATRFGIEAMAIAGLAVSVPFGSRAAALFGYGAFSAFPVGLGCGLALSLGVWVVGGTQSERLDSLRQRFVELMYRLFDRIERWLERRRPDNFEGNVEEDSGTEGGGETAAGCEDPESVAVASNLVEQAAGRIADNGLVIRAAEEMDTLARTNSGVQDRIGLLWSRVSGTVSQSSLTAGMALQLSAAEEAHEGGDTEKAESLTDSALELAAPTIGSVAAAVVRGRPGGIENMLGSLAPLLAQIDRLLGDEELPTSRDDPEGFQLIQQLLERLIEEEAGEGFDTALSRIRAAAADGWYSVQAGDNALEGRGETADTDIDPHQRALVAYLAAIKAYRQAYDIATDATETATAKRAQPDEADESASDTDQTVTASANSYASEANRISTAIEALLHDTAAVVVGATDALYGDQPDPTVDTEARRTIVRTLRTLRQTRTRIDASVPPIELADDRYQRAEIARSVVRLRRHLETADEAAAAGNVGSAVDQYERVADRLDVLSNRAGTVGLTETARELSSTAAQIGALAAEPTAEGVANRPEPSIPSTDEVRTPEIAPAGRRLRRTFCSPSFVELWEFVDEAGDHAILDIAGEPYPDLVGSVGVAIGGLDPLYTEPDVESLSKWASEVSVDALSAAVESVSERHSQLAAAEPPPPPAFAEPPAVLQDASITTLPTADGIDAYSETWLSRATALVEAGEVIDRRSSALDGFAALEPRVRKALEANGRLSGSQVNAELLVVSNHHLSGVEYDAESEVLSKTGEISRREPAAASATEESPDADPAVQETAASDPAASEAGDSADAANAGDAAEATNTADAADAADGSSQSD